MYQLRKVSGPVRLARNPRQYDHQTTSRRDLTLEAIAEVFQAVLGEALALKLTLLLNQNMCMNRDL